MSDTAVETGADPGATRIEVVDAFNIEGYGRSYVVDYRILGGPPVTNGQVLLSERTGVQWTAAVCKGFVTPPADVEMLVLRADEPDAAVVPGEVLRADA